MIACLVPREYHSSAKLVMPKHSAVHSVPLPDDDVFYLFFQKQKMVAAHQRSK
jgi:hypothetical protein